MNMGKRTVAALAAVLVTLLAGGAASAGQPIREPLLFEDFTLENVCPFPVLVEATAQKEFITFFADGRVQVTGKFFVRLTNTSTGQSLDLNISGPAILAPVERYFGRSIILLFPTDASGPGLVLTTGRTDIIRAEDGSIVQFDPRGRTVDVCAALA
jgi:hypothetical protein